MKWGDIKVGDVAVHGGLSAPKEAYLVVRVGDKDDRGYFVIEAVSLETGVPMMSAGKDEDMHDNFTVLRDGEELS